jgi:hypothetical protein
MNRVNTKSGMAAKFKDKIFAEIAQTVEKCQILFGYSQFTGDLKRISADMRNTALDF